MKLQKAGAGLPNFERLFIKRILVPTVRTIFTWNIALFMLKREVNIIHTLVKNRSTQEMKEQIIIDRTFAIEDDSRRFSINMVLEHLVIAGTLVKEVIESLSQEIAVENEITIESVKPRKNSDEALENFIYFYEDYIQSIKKLPKKKSMTTKKHPWFINFNNFDWSVFMYMHTFIHRRQIEEIISNLGKHNV